MSNALAVVMGLLAAACLAVPVVRGVHPQHRPQPRASAIGFRVGPLWSWCPVEKSLTPHRIDAGLRRCHSCKSTTPMKEQGHG
ncbi:hypothetical protein [Streptomyces sp. NPDC058548]|uniref:hypothetical protein n=1 Tax=Streptomyces sp. NPDC058548 TaxID=3346545 RepID=UPI003658E2D1